MKIIQTYKSKYGQIIKKMRWIKIKIFLIDFANNSKFEKKKVFSQVKLT